MIAAGGNPVDLDAIALACHMGLQKTNAQLYAVHVIEVDRSLPLGAQMEEAVERGETILDEIEKVAQSSGLKLETELLQARDTGPAIVEEAIDWSATSIVMGLPYKRRFGEFNLGRTVPYVLKNAPCRVILYREKLEGC